MKIRECGKAYRRNDEIGTPLCITVDFDTFENAEETVTIRDRDSMQQQRIAVKELICFIKNYFLTLKDRSYLFQERSSELNCEMLQLLVGLQMEYTTVDLNPHLN